MDSVLHDNEIPVDIELVGQLVVAQFPQFAELTLSRLPASGSSNVLFRLGEDLLVRLPRQPGGGDGIAKERRWLPHFKQRLPVAVPEVLEVGKPGFGYSEQWSIVRWLEGDLVKAYAGDRPTDVDRNALAHSLADVILALQSVEVSEEASRDPSLRWYRGGALADFDKVTRRNIEKCRSIEDLGLDLDAALTYWDRAMQLPGVHKPGPTRWYHSDLVAENLLVTDGRLSAVLDFGGLAVGDPTIDLHGMWEILDSPSREILRSRLNVEDAQWARGRAWALGIALGAFTYYWAKMPGRMQDRLAMAQAVLADDG
ncbi:MAG: phosphotransferase [Pseudomonadales bacterium]|nr:phosphotransferase [Pseudomonadales bacterium]